MQAEKQLSLYEIEKQKEKDLLRRLAEKYYPEVTNWGNRKWKPKGRRINDI